MPLPSNTVISSLNLDDTVAIFPSLRLKFSRENMAADLKSITCPISGNRLTSNSAFNLVGTTGFQRSSATLMDVALALSTSDFLCLVNADTTSISSATEFGKPPGIGGAIKLRGSTSYSYYDGSNVAGDYVTMGATPAGNLSVSAMAVLPAFELMDKYSVYADGTTAVSKVVGVKTGTINAPWSINTSFLLGSPTNITYHSIYVLEFVDGMPPDAVIKDGLLWMSENRDKGLPPMWRNLR